MPELGQKLQEGA